jgi:hypothetical protein
MHRSLEKEEADANTSRLGKGESRLLRSVVWLYIRQRFFENLKETVSREENKTIFSGLRITEMAFFGKSFYLPRMTNPGRCVIESN